MSYQTKATGWQTTPARQAGASAARSAHAERAVGRREDYEWLTGEIGVSREEAAARVGVSVRTVQRWAAEGRAGR